MIDEHGGLAAIVQKCCDSAWMLPIGMREDKCLCSSDVSKLCRLVGSFRRDYPLLHTAAIVAEAGVAAVKRGREQVVYSLKKLVGVIEAKTDTVGDFAVFLEACRVYMELMALNGETAAAIDFGWTVRPRITAAVQRHPLLGFAYIRFTMGLSGLLGGDVQQNPVICQERCNQRRDLAFEALDITRTKPQLKHALPSTLTMVAITFLEANNPTEAIQFLQEALQIDPDHKDARRRMARCLWLLGQDREAEECVNAVLQQDAGYDYGDGIEAPLSIMKAWMCETDGRREECLQYISRAYDASTTPSTSAALSVAVRASIADLYEKIGLRDRAVAIDRELDEAGVSPRPSSLLREAQMLVEHKDLDGAAGLLSSVASSPCTLYDSFRSAKNVGEVHIQAFTLLADIRCEQGLHEEAQVIRKKADSRRKDYVNVIKAMLEEVRSEARSRRKRVKKKGSRKGRKKQGPQERGAGVSREISSRVEEGDEVEEECAICLDVLEEDEAEAISALGCGHRFHEETCMTQWRAKCREKGHDVTCPMCRLKLDQI